MATIHLKRTLLFGILSLSLLLPISIKAQTSATLDVKPGMLQDMLLDLDFTPTQLILKGKLNSTDLSYINKGAGKLSNVSDLDLSAISLEYDGGMYASEKGDDGTGIGLGTLTRSFYLSETCYTDTTTRLNGLGGYETTHDFYSNNLAGLFISNKSVRNIKLPENLPDIGSFIYYGCSTLVSTSLPKEINDIPDGAFWETTSLMSLDLPNTITSIGNNAFNNSSIQEIRLTNLTSIGDYAFKDSPIKEIELSGVNKLGKGAFSNTIQLSEANLNSITIIPKECFSNSGIQKVNFNKSLIEIGEGAFSGCKQLLSLELPEGLLYIRASGLDGAGIIDINIPSSIIGVGRYALNIPWLYNQPTEEGIWYCNRIAYVCNEKEIGDVITIKEGIKTIAAGFCNYNKNIKKVILPSTIEEIGIIEEKNRGNWSQAEGAFMQCDNLEEINLPEGVKVIGDGAFATCKKLNIPGFPSTLTAIGGGAFNGCSSLTSTIVIGENFNYMGGFAFTGCTSVYELKFNSSITTPYLWDGGFNSSGIESVIIGPKVSYIPNEFMFRCKTLAKVKFEEPISGNDNLIIGDQAFYECSNLKLESLPSRLSKVGKEAFMDVNFKETFSTENIISIGYRGFDGITGVKELYITDKLMECGVNAFSIKSLEKVSYSPRNLTVISDYAGSLFSGSSNLKNIVIGKNVEYIPEMSFKDLSSVEELIFEHRENTSLLIDEKAFYGMKGLTSLVLPDVKTAIGESAFEQCRNLSSYHIGYGTESIYPKAFYNPSVDLKEIDIPETVAWIGESAFNSGGSDVTLYFHSLVPPVMESPVCLKYATAYVPAESLEAYQETGLNNCTILPYDDEHPENGITAIESDRSGNYTVYNLQGLKILTTQDQNDIETLKDGIYIINGKKILIQNKK